MYKMGIDKNKNNFNYKKLFKTRKVITLLQTALLRHYCYYIIHLFPCNVRYLLIIITIIPQSFIDNEAKY